MNANEEDNQEKQLEEVEKIEGEMTSQDLDKVAGAAGAHAYLFQ